MKTESGQHSLSVRGTYALREPLKLIPDPLTAGTMVQTWALSYLSEPRLSVENTVSGEVLRQEMCPWESEGSQHGSAPRAQSAVNGSLRGR